MWGEDKIKRGTNRKQSRFFRKVNRIGIQKIANWRIVQLFTLAEESKVNDPIFARKCVKLAHKIALRSRVRIPLHLRRKICPHCLIFLRPGVNCHIRTRTSSQPHIVFHCHSCGKISRIPYKLK
ncbi:MAG: ribonuclease P protein component 4 [Promethearchaeota archaeon]